MNFETNFKQLNEVTFKALHSNVNWSCGTLNFVIIVASLEGGMLQQNYPKQFASYTQSVTVSVTSKNWFFDQTKRPGGNFC